jgi:periplasmic protein TonB
MPAELFRSTLPPSPVRRRASVLPLSIVTHVLVIAAVVLGPMVAPGELPEPNRPLLYAVTAVDLPSPPRVQRVRPPAAATQTTSASKAPLDAPTEIEPESSIETTTFGADLGPVDIPGLPGGVPGGLDGPATAYEPPPALPQPRAPLKIGGQIVAPRRLRSVAPVYPAFAQQARVEGAVVIEAVIGEDGHVREARVTEGKPLLNDAALTAVRQWTFTPTRLNGQPVAVIMTVTVVFSLR